MMKKWVLPTIAALVGIAVSAYFYAELPDQMAIHFGPSDEPDRFAGKAVGAFLLPAIMLLVVAITNLSAKLESDEQKRRRLNAANSTVSVVVAVVMLAVHLFTLAYNLGYEISPSLVAPLLVGITFIAVGNVLPRMPQGTLKLFRMDDSKYPRYARFQGRLMVLAGFVVLLSVMLPHPFGMYVLFAVIAALLVSVIGGVSYFSRLGR